MLSGPILPTLLRLALPNVLALAAATLTGIAETSYIGILGTAPLAAMALVFPFIMLTQMFSSGAMGGGVSSAIARALGGGSVTRAEALAWHALAIGVGAGIVNSVVFVVFGPPIYAFLGGKDEVLAQAVGYSNVLFCGAVMVWLSNSLISVLRGTGNMKVPSGTLLGVAALQVVLGGSLGLGLGPVPRLGMPGVALGYIGAYSAGVAFLAWYLLSGRSRVKLVWRGFAFNKEMFVDILKVGAVACLSPIQSIATILVITALVARFGTQVLAGYGIGVRLEFLLIPIAFGVGVASVPMVGMAMGAGDIDRARRVAWTAGVVSGIGVGVLGLVVAVFPDLWARLFSSDPAVLVAARQYLRMVGPVFGFFGVGLSLYFASQGSGKVLGPVLGTTLRLVIVAVVGYWLVEISAPVEWVFGLIACAMALYGFAVAGAIYLTPWEKPRN